MQTHQPLQPAKDTHTVSRAHTPMPQQAPQQLIKPTPAAALIRRATADPGSLRRAEVLQLHRTIGNRAVGKLFGRATRRRGQREDGLVTENQTGLPDQLKTGMENLSGISLDDVKVHYNSVKPAQLHALAYTQGTEIHVGSGQEQHLPHEAWHVVQQKQGRVNPTMQIQGIAVNDHAGLEQEAERMGAEAIQRQEGRNKNTRTGRPNQSASASSVVSPRSHTNQGTVVQRRNGAAPQNFTVTGTAADTPHLTIRTDKSWTSSTGSLAELDDVEMRERVTFNHNPVLDIPSYPIVVPTIAGMALAGNVLTKVAGTMQTGGGSDNHQGAGYGPSFTVAGQANLTKGLWTLIGTQVYEFRDRGAHGPWTPLHPGTFTITRTMAVNPTTHQYELTFTKTGPFGVNETAGPTPILMTTTEAMQDVGAARPDQTALWNTLNTEITTTQEHEYQPVNFENKVINGVALPVEYQITRPRTAPAQSPARAAFAPFETITPAEYNPLIANVRGALDTLIGQYLTGLVALPACVIIIFTKTAGGVRQQALYLAGVGGAGPTLRIVFRYDKFSQIALVDKNTTMAGRESKRSRSPAGKIERWQKATVIHEMGHMLHAFNDMAKYQSAVVDMGAAAAAPAAIQPQMYQIANVNQHIVNALNAKNYKGKWNYAKANPAEVVAEVWTALIHGRNVPRGLAAVYLAYGGMRNAAIDNRLRRLFPHNQIPVFNQPEDALPFI